MEVVLEMTTPIKQVQGGEDEGWAVFLPPPRLCMVCQTDLAKLPKSARYCPHCCGELEITSPICASPSCAGKQRSIILHGFARAMYLLGCRYENSVGKGHNPAEAMRCFSKAAKMGDPAAIEKLKGRLG